MSYQEISHKGMKWVNITRPSPAEMAQLHSEFPFLHPLNIEDCLNPNERPKIDEYPEYLFVVMIFPHWDKESEISRPAEVHFFIGKNFLVTVHEGQIKPLNQIVSDCVSDKEIRQTHLGSSTAHLLHMLIDRLVDHIFPILGKVDGHIVSIEETLFSTNTAQTIRRIAFVRRDIIALRRIVSPQLAILNHLKRVKFAPINAKLAHYFDDTLDHLTKAHDILEEDMDVITHLADTSDALSTHRINEIMRILTVISVIILPMTLIVGAFGMNFHLPLENHPLAFWYISGGMLGISLLMILFFRRQNWL